MSREYICSTCAGDPRWTTEFYRAIAQDTGALLIEKRLRPGHPFGRSLPDRERRMTLHLAKLGLPVARLCPPDYYDAWSVVSEFAGLNLRCMTLHEQTTRADAAAAWGAATLATARMAAANVLVTDWAARNVAYPLSNGLSGRARFADPRLLDHAFTQSGANGADVQNGNIWMQADQGILAPEVRRILREEQAEALAQLNAMTGGAVRELAALTVRPDCEALFGRIHLGSVSLQARLRDGSLDPDRAMQHAIGYDALTLLAMFGARRTDLAGIAWLGQRRAVFEKMCAGLPADRYGSLTDAAAALVEGEPDLPAESTFSLPTLNLETLIRRPREATRPLEAEPASNVDGAIDTLPLETTPPGDPGPDGPPSAAGSKTEASAVSPASETRAPLAREGLWLRAAGLGAGFAAMVALSLPGPRGLEEVSSELARRAVVDLAAQATYSNGPEPMRAAIRDLVVASNDRRPAVSREAARHLALLWRETRDAIFRALLSRESSADAVIERLASRVNAFSAGGYKPAAALSRRLDNAAACGGSAACLRQAIDGLHTEPPAPLVGSRSAAGNSG